MWFRLKGAVRDVGWGGGVRKISGNFLGGTCTKPCSILGLVCMGVLLFEDTTMQGLGFGGACGG